MFLKFEGGPLDGMRERWAKRPRGMKTVYVEPLTHVKHVYYYEQVKLGNCPVAITARYHGVEK